MGKGKCNKCACEKYKLNPVSFVEKLLVEQTEHIKIVSVDIITTIIHKIVGLSTFLWKIC